MKTIIRFEPLLGGYLIMDDGEIFLIKKENINEILGDLESYSIITNNHHPLNSYSAPIRVQIQVTPFCNLFCLTCGVPNTERDAKIMSSDFIKDFLNSLIGHGVLSLEWSGGEPLIRKNFQAISDYAYDLGFNQNILTNGLMINKDSVGFLAKNFYQLQVSMDGVRELYDTIVGRPMWYKFLSSLELALASNLKSKITIAVVLQDRNADEIYHLVRFCHKLGVEKIRISPQVPIGRSSIISWEKYSKVIDRFRKHWPKIKEYGETNGLIISCLLDKPLVQSDSPQEMISLVSPGGYSFLYIDAYGRIYPFPFLSTREFYLGSVYQDDLLKIWHNSVVLNKLRKISYKKIGCGGCLAECSFADRSLVYAFTKDINGLPLPHQECLLNLTRRR